MNRRQRIIDRWKNIVSIPPLSTRLARWKFQEPTEPRLHGCACYLLLRKDPQLLAVGICWLETLQFQNAQPGFSTISLPARASSGAVSDGCTIRIEILSIVVAEWAATILAEQALLAPSHQQQIRRSPPVDPSCPCRLASSPYRQANMVTKVCDCG